MKSIVSMILLLAFSTGVANASNSGITHRLGASGGFPQMVALTYQVSVSRMISLEGCIGSVPYYYNTAGWRMIIGDTSTGLKLRGFAGIVVVDDVVSSNNDAASYLWTGAGLGYAFDHCRLFVDLGYTGGGDTDKGLGYSTGAALNGGFLFDL